MVLTWHRYCEGEVSCQYCWKHYKIAFLSRKQETIWRNVLSRFYSGNFFCFCWVVGHPVGGTLLRQLMSIHYLATFQPRQYAFEIQIYVATYSYYSTIYSIIKSNMLKRVGISPNWNKYFIVLVKLIGCKFQFHPPPMIIKTVNFLQADHSGRIWPRNEWSEEIRRVTK